MSVEKILQERAFKQDVRTATGFIDGEKLRVWREYSRGYWAVTVTIGLDVDMSLHFTKFFADRKFDGLVKKHNLMIHSSASKAREQNG